MALEHREAGKLESFIERKAKFYFPKGKLCKTFWILFQKCYISKMRGINKNNLNSFSVRKGHVQSSMINKDNPT